tara:strand:+ start:2492 stop:2644 length:153 start_codon:yes stop_codon:yes gene_type:complete
VKGLIHKAISWGLKKGKSIESIQKYIFDKYNITIAKGAILKRIKRNFKKD